MAAENLEARRVSLIFGALALVTALLMGSIVATVLTVTTGQDGQALVVGLIIALAAATACGVAVALHTRTHFQPVAAPGARSATE
jgi:uncharacterized membrane-anchored protein